MRSQENQEGYVIVTVGVLIVVLLGFVALGIDVGVLSSARTSAQRAADAAALGAAFVYVTRPDLDETTTPKLSEVVTDYAKKVAASNKILEVAVNVSEVTATPEVADRRVTVTLTHSQPTFFASILGEYSANITVTAVAEAAFNATGDRCTKPWFVPNTVLDNGSGQGALCNACSATPPHVLIETSGADPEVSQYAQDWMTAQDALPSNNNPPPRQFTIKPQNPSQAISPGQFFAIRLGDGNGASWYEQNIRTCPDQAVFCQTSYPSEPGAMVGPTKQGVNALVNYNRDANCNNCDRDTYVAVGKYQRPASQGGGIFSSSRSLAIAPVIDVCVFCPDNFPSGTESGQFTVIGFALVFIEGIQGNEVKARLIDVLDCAGGNPPQEASGAYSVPVRLVRTS
ncbi:MAG: pilus assembly protein TadG-related protein [Acidobacteriota bacterium]